MTPYLLLVFAVAFVAALVLTPFTIRLARRLNWLDQPAPRRTHQIPTPRLGGIPLAVAFVAGIVLTFAFPRFGPIDENERPRVIGLCVGVLIVAVVGLIDDVRELKAAPLFTMQLGVALIAIASGVIIQEIASPLDGSPIKLPDVVAILFTLFWIVGMMNTVNFLDGVDGLVGGVTVIASVILFLHNFKLTQYSIALLPLALIGATLGFLIFNFPPAKIFLGSGAYVLGFALAVLAIIGGAKMATALLALGIPILDVAWQIANRLRVRRSPFAGDRGHLHHRLYDSGLSMRAIVLVYYLLTAAFGALALILPSGIPKTIALVVIGGGALAVLARLRRQ
ncbi:MAG: undecaprenyl/decaprenyl-phosphate alpha-N-acetylglucosaminyl 1-phosphate transferase [Chloroflexi bacterium]|nr:undecaprenyl/decaprenyl-phosphate alpha-N-acetylglucosaminyl 1-phosphate transferase [Chloroflexota bacterium]